MRWRRCHGAIIIIRPREGAGRPEIRLEGSRLHQQLHSPVQGNAHHGRRLVVLGPVALRSATSSRPSAEMRGPDTWISRVARSCSKAPSPSVRQAALRIGESPAIWRSDASSPPRRP